MIRSISRVVSVSVLAGFFTLGCAPNRGTGTSTGDGKGDSPTTEGPGIDLAGAVGFDGGVSDKCGVQNFMLQKGLPPEVMIVLDRSGSMSTALGTTTRWSAVGDAVKQVVSALQGNIAWGLSLFPTDDSCGTSTNVDVAVGTGNAATIGMKIDSYTPGGSTPTADAVKAAAADMAARTTPNPKYLLLSTDGEPNCSPLTFTCGCILGKLNTTTMQCCIGPICLGPCSPIPAGDDVAAAELAVKDAAAQGIHTFVVGVAADSTDHAALETLAVAGGEARSTSPKYFPAGSQADLVSAVNTIAGEIVSCSFALASTPPGDLSLVDVNLNGNLVPRDATHANGWDFGANNMSIVFFGAACTNLQAQSSTQVQAVYRCPPVQ